jgi:hypothetical protein
VVGRVLRAVGNREAEIEVVRVLKGNLKVGQKLEMSVYKAKERVGTLRLLSIPGVQLGPTCEDLPITFEDEVRWLIDRPKVKTVEKAVLLARGWSNFSRRVGIAFLEERKTFPAKEIVAAITDLRKKGGDRTYEIGCLVDVLLLKESEVGFAFIREEVAAWLEGKGKAIDWKDVPVKVSARGAWLTALVGACGEHWTPMYYQKGRKRSPAHAKLRTEVKGLLLDALPERDLASMADVTYALAWTKTATLAEIAAAFPKDGGRDGFALGLYWTGRKQKSWWRREEALASFRTALDVAKRPELIATLRKALPKKKAE